MIMDDVVRFKESIKHFHGKMRERFHALSQKFIFDGAKHLHSFAWRQYECADSGSQLVQSLLINNKPVWDAPCKNQLEIIEHKIRQLSQNIIDAGLEPKHSPVIAQLREELLSIKAKNLVDIEKHKSSAELVKTFLGLFSGDELSFLFGVDKKITVTREQVVVAENFENDGLNEDD